jgi:ABC-type glycerol-3-phosphate transport system permease component
MAKLLADINEETIPVGTIPEMGKMMNGSTRRNYRSGAKRPVVKGDTFLVWILLIGGSIFMLAPFLFLVTSSLKSQMEVFAYPPKWIPNPAHFENYIQVFIVKPFHIYIRNTLFIIVLNEIAILWSSSFCAYGFSRIHFPGRNFWFNVVLITMMLPGIVLMVPSFVIFSKLGWIDSYLPFIIPAFFGGGAFNIFLLTQFFRTLPEDLADAARIDGCDEYRIYSLIFLPLAKPALATVAIFTFLNAWNDFTGPLLYLNTAEKYTVSMGLTLFRGALLQTRWDLLMAASVIMTLPVLLLFFFAQRYFVQGIVMTGLKG